MAVVGIHVAVGVIQHMVRRMREREDGSCKIGGHGFS